MGERSQLEKQKRGTPPLFKSQSTDARGVATEEGRIFARLSEKCRISPFPLPLSGICNARKRREEIAESRMQLTAHHYAHQPFEGSYAEGRNARKLSPPRHWVIHLSVKEIAALPAPSERASLCRRFIRKESKSTQKKKGRQNQNQNQ